MQTHERDYYLKIVIRKLVAITIISGTLLGTGIYVIRGGERTFLTLIVFMLGLVGGFISIQQRLPSIEPGELKLLSESWYSVVMIPVNGGIVL